MTVRQTTYFLALGLLLVGCGEKFAIPSGMADAQPTVEAEKAAEESKVEPLLEPVFSVADVESLESLLESSEELAAIQASQFEQREQELEAIQKEVEAIRKQLLLERYEKLEKEAKKKDWDKKETKPKAKKEAKRFEEWRYIQQQRVDLGVPEIKATPMLDQKVAEEPEWRKRGN